jgi:hypothetical protein
VIENLQKNIFEFLFLISLFSRNFSNNNKGCSKETMSYFETLQTFVMAVAAITIEKQFGVFSRVRSCMLF